ncbi:efflux transporter outer membrane subunit [Novosphingobium sp. KCTC 2891]|uniref:efflux transporter outer membrane subunit n=1 Tax=Novosphingobium sp. KCTC 2891 TaxID=2989730 RepID=UPI0022215DB7|nr:efflux transporter outer membrane subunit [Novosphingobium sp. KCTC 2891]MCW1383575.1 efflux transporter outer membrane subunit [Novosphingobium sp. KCTC 2891]
MSGPSFLRAALTGVATMALAACTVGPDYHLPQKAAVNLPAANGPLGQEPGPRSGLTRPDDLPPRWWHMYDDPVLDQLEEQALAGNTELRVAAANLARAQSMTRAAEGANEPEFSVEAAAQRARLSGESFLLPESLPVANLGHVGVEMSYQLDLFGRVRRSVEAARADEETDEALMGAVKVTLAAEVARAYLAHCGAQEGGDLAEAALKVQERIADSARRLAAAGRTSTIEVTAAEGRVAQARAEIPLHAARSRAALYRLAFLMGRAPADFPREALACRRLPMIARPLPVGDGAALLARRPDVRAAERQLAAATARIGVATADLYPHIGFGISAGSTGFLADIGKAAANSWGIGSLIQWAFPGAGARERVRAAHADTDRALARFDGVVLGALRETETALSSYQHDHDRALALADARDAEERAAEEQKRLHDAGRAPVQADLGGQFALVAARARELAGREAVAQDQVTLFLALGGGW